MIRLLAIGLGIGALLVAGSAIAAAPDPRLEGRLARAEEAVAALEHGARELAGLSSGAGAAPGDDVRYADAEARFHAGDHAAATSLLVGLLGDARFLASGRTADARRLLAEALYRQGNLREARAQYRDLVLSREGVGADLGLDRYLELCDRLGDFEGADAVLAAAGPASAYILAKWTYRRTDLPLEERLRRAEATFALLADGPAAARARYFQGVIAVQRGQLDAAAEHFAAAARTAGPAETALVELAHLSLGRVHHEQEKWELALAHYGAIGADAEGFDDALFEIAWTFARMRAFERALRVADLLVAVVERSPRVADARLLRAHLLVEAGRYDEGRAAFAAMARDYGTVRDDVEAMLRRHADPVAYFDRLIASREAPLGAGDLLPPSAASFGDVRAEVERALGTGRALAETRRGLAEARAVAAGILARLDRGVGVEASPELAVGLARARAAAAGIETWRANLRRLEADAGGRARLSPELAARIDRLGLRLDALRGPVAAAAERLRHLSDRAAAALREEVAAEVRRLDELEAETAAAGEGQRELGGAMAVEAIEVARRRFDDLSVRSDAGVADVAWRKKRDRAAEIRRLAEERDRDLRDLEAALREVGEGAP